MKPLKVALFSGNYNYVMDGPVLTLNRLVRFLEDQGCTVEVYAPTTDTPACEPAGTLVSAPSVPIPGRGEYRLALGLPKRLRARIEAFGPDIFHLSAPDWLGHSAQALALRLGAPVLSTCHTRFETYLRYYGVPWLEKGLTAWLTRFYNRCDVVCAPSPSMIATLRAQGVASDLRLWSRGVDRTAFNPARRDMDWRRSLGFADDETVVVFVGRLVLEKGLDKLAGLYAEAGRDAGARLRFLVVGDGPERERLAEQMPDAAFTGHLAPEDLGRAYASGDIFFNPSVTETFGNVTLEAMACGLPTVCADATGSTSLIADGVRGLVARGGQGFYPLVEALARDPERRAAMGEAARAESERYDWDAVMQAMAENYAELTGGAAQRRAQRSPRMSPGMPLAQRARSG